MTFEEDVDVFLIRSLINLINRLADCLTDCSTDCSTDILIERKRTGLINFLMSFLMSFLISFLMSFLISFLTDFLTREKEARINVDEIFSRNLTIDLILVLEDAFSVTDDSVLKRFFREERRFILQLKCMSFEIEI